ncbi:MAG: ATP-dependent Clp protease adaptor ClpS [Bacteroidetes bacterium]|jgi:ATP-dependent Clp protease adaptor protein ClpS|nr:ATP-dependent Clp protease adaptor ClpS [Bacteroidota bacterium]
MGKYQQTEKPVTEELIEDRQVDENFLILHDDDVHTFDYVIDALIDIFELEVVEAEQITYIVHYKGKCDVKKGTKEFLSPYRRSLAKKGLKATID